MSISAISIQHAYVKKAKVALVGSNLNDVVNGYSGSVIIGKDSVFAVNRLTGIKGSNIQNAVLSDLVSFASDIGIPSKGSRGLPTTPDSDLLSRKDLGVTRNYNSKSYRIKSLDLTATTISETQCDGKFCCTLKATLNSTSEATYK